MYIFESINIFPNTFLYLYTLEKKTSSCLFLETEQNVCHLIYSQSTDGRKMLERQRSIQSRELVVFQNSEDNKVNNFKSLYNFKSPYTYIQLSPDPRLVWTSLRNKKGKLCYFTSCCHLQTTICFRYLKVVWLCLCFV